MAALARTEKDFQAIKTPSRRMGGPESFDEGGEDDDDYNEMGEPPSSPFQDVIAEIQEEKRKILQPIRTKSTKGTISFLSK